MSVMTRRLSGAITGSTEVLKVNLDILKMIISLKVQSMIFIFIVKKHLQLRVVKYE